jgi:hypothetical protein
MTATTISAPVSAHRSWMQVSRVVLMALAIVILLTVSFVVGRATVSTSHRSPAITPAPAATSASVSVPSAGQFSVESCHHVDRPC